jgi:predicted O-methyltransferase YrrM
MNQVVYKIIEGEPSDWDKITDLKDGPVQYEMTGTGNIKMVQHPYPYSIKEAEFNYLTNIIKEHNLQRGYECATAFGVSSLAIGLGFKATGGKCVTLDAYIEEKCKDPGAYQTFASEVYEKADGYKSVKYLIDKFGLQDTLYPEIGWSPDDTETAVRKHFSEPLDFVFLDAGHFPEQMIKDIDSFLPLMGEKWVIAFHDVYPWSCTNEVQDYFFQKTGKRIEIKVPHPAGENLGVAFNL